MILNCLYCSIKHYGIDWKPLNFVWYPKDYLCLNNPYVLIWGVFRLYHLKNIFQEPVHKTKSYQKETGNKELKRYNTFGSKFPNKASCNKIIS